MKILKTVNYHQYLKHLDVYKRQNPTETLLLLQNEIESEERVICEWIDIDTEKRKNYQYVENDIIKTLGAVSYTHLDVYKRQKQRNESKRNKKWI